MYTKLKYDKYKEFLQKEKNLCSRYPWILCGRYPCGGYHWIFKFPNGYGASIIKHCESYGGEDDLFELAVILYDENGEWDLCYTTDITDDVIGYLNNNDVLELLERIKNYE